MSIDIQWHTDVGRDEFFTPPHFMVLGGLPICFALCLYFIISSANSKHALETEGNIKISNFHAPAEIWLTLVGLVTILIGGFYDNYWHAQFGVDTTIVTPPHILTLSGGMLAEFSAIILIYKYCQVDGNELDGKLKLSLLVLLWTLFYHLSFASMNFLDSRYAFVDVFGHGVMLHLFLAPLVIYFICKLITELFGFKILLQFGITTLIIQTFLLIANPIFVELLMGEFHSYRPGAPTPVWSAHSISWLFLPLCVLITKYDLLNKVLILTPLLILSDTIFSPLAPENFAFDRGLATLIFNIILSFIIIVSSIGLIDKYVSVFHSSNRTQKKLSINMRAIMVIVLVLLISPVSAHHPSFIPGNGLDAPMRVQTHLDETIVDVEFMLWPPKAPQKSEVMLLAIDSNKTVSSLWIELHYEDELDDVIMPQEFDKFTNQDIWLGDVRFTFSGNQTVVVKGIIDGEIYQDSFQIDVEEPTSIEPWQGWTISSIWASILILLPWYLSRRQSA